MIQQPRRRTRDDENSTHRHRLWHATDYGRDDSKDGGSEDVEIGDADTLEVSTGRRQAE